MAPGQQHHGHGFPGAPNGDGPPPSTLAAQLVQNIGGAADSHRSSRPDENQELRHLVSVIENFTDRPELLRTAEERISHNHMLTYVAVRTGLENLALDDPFVNLGSLRTKISDTITLLKNIIKETPEVLTRTTDGREFLYRGTEPLWMWLLPKVLRLLGHSSFKESTAAIEDFCRFSIPYAKSVGLDLVKYYKGTVQAIVSHVEKSITSSHGKAPKVISLQLPPRETLATLNPTDAAPSIECTYRVSTLSEAIDHSVSLVSSLVQSRSAPHPKKLNPERLELVPWLMDVLCSLLGFHDVAGKNISASILRHALTILLSFSSRDEMDIAVRDKVHEGMALICIRVAEKISVLTKGDELRDVFCTCLLQLTKAATENEPLASLIRLKLCDSLEAGVRDHPTLTKGTIFEACTSLLSFAVSSSSTPEAVGTLAKEKALANPMLAGPIEELHLPCESEAPSDDSSDEPAAKRRKTSSVVSNTPLVQVLLNRLFRLYGAPLDGDNIQLEKTFLAGFEQMSDQTRCKAINLLGRIPCAADKTLKVSKAVPLKKQTFHCTVCCAPRENERPECKDIATKATATRLLCQLVQQDCFKESKRPRIVAMIVLRRFVFHSCDPELLDIEISAPGQWCVQSLQSSIRELRIASGRALAMFLRAGSTKSLDEEIAERNTANALSLVRTIEEKNKSNLNETCIMFWSQAGRIVPDDKLCLVLIKLIEYLGHREQIVSAFAYNEIMNLAAAKGQDPKRLLDPYWKDLAFSAVKNLVVNPRTTGLVADLLLKDVATFVKSVQQHALPWLILTKRKEVVQKIADFRGEKDAWKICVDNLSQILALLLIQDVPQADLEKYVMALLRHVSSHFNDLTLRELVASEPVLVILNILKIAGESQEAQKTRVRAAVETVAAVLEAKAGVKKKHQLSHMLQQHALGITTRLAEVINDNSSRSTPVEQRRCIRAMQEFINLGKADIRVARPQISAFLLSVLAYDQLRSAALSCWATMLRHFDKEDVEALLETTFFIIRNYWQTFDQSSRRVCQDVLVNLMDNHRNLLEEKINELPSFSHITGLAEQEHHLSALRTQLDQRLQFDIFVKRVGHENSGVVLQALTELAVYLRDNQGYLQTSAISEQPDSIVTQLARALLDCSAKYQGIRQDVTTLCAECIGLAGCLDPNRIETVREKKQFVLLHNFEHPEEISDFGAFILENVLVKAFLSTSDIRFQGFLSYAMQEILERCDFKPALALGNSDPGARVILEKWEALPDSTKEVLKPFMTSQYRVADSSVTAPMFPIFRKGRAYGSWIKALVHDLLRKGQNSHAQLVFDPLSRVIKMKEAVVAEFLLPYLVVHITVGNSTEEVEKERVLNELLEIIQYDLPEDANYTERENMKLYYEAVFGVMDYARLWLQKKNEAPVPGGTEDKHVEEITRVQELIDAVPADLMARRAVFCNQYARALFYLEPYIEDKGIKAEDDEDGAVESDQPIADYMRAYAEIDDPDGMEGILASINVTDMEWQILSHRKAGRWTAAQTWYEVRLAEEPDSVDHQMNLLTCLRESGQYDVLLNHVEGMTKTPSSINKIVPIAVEASWATGRWETLHKYIGQYSAGETTEVFNIGIAQALLHLRNRDLDLFQEQVKLLREKVASSLSYSVTNSLTSAHDATLKAHILTDLEMIATGPSNNTERQQELLKTLNRRFEVIGAYVTDKQYLLSIRRAAMSLMGDKFAKADISSMWLSSARLARKSGLMQQSFNAVIHARELGDRSAPIENARLMWKDGHHRKAIQMLEFALKPGGAFLEPASFRGQASTKATEAEKLATARAHLLHAKWLDAAGQSSAGSLRSYYQEAAKTHTQWEKGHYYLGRHYKKILESEQFIRVEDQSDEYLSGETAKLVIENYLRSLNYGTKYLYQTLPRILTLWLEIGAKEGKASEGKHALSTGLLNRRKQQLKILHESIDKHAARLPAYIFYTALPQITARIAHPNPQVYLRLKTIIMKVVNAHPRQAIWSVFGFMTSKVGSELRRDRGNQILTELRSQKHKAEGCEYDVNKMLHMADKLGKQLLAACSNGDFQSNRTVTASITRDLLFNHKCTPCPLVVPIEKTLTATLPTLTDNVRKHKAFAGDVITIVKFEDEVLVLGSLAKPRRLTARASNGERYHLMIKPKDDLRTDQRLMEFNGIINRALKRDALCSRRQLYVRTNAVTPLNEECGIIEWVDGLKTLRDILLNLYKARNIAPNYNHIASLMQQSIAPNAPENMFRDQILVTFPPVLQQWFVHQFPAPSTWFAARLRYTRSCAVMSMLGTILGLGDRHGENVLLEVGNGGIFHVDFNCLFEKGLTFAQPERVPFRLTHNMQAAMGRFEHEGPFRRCAELTLEILRLQEETLMTILEAFIYDPTLDLQREKKKKGGRDSGSVVLNPQAVVDTIKRKVRGLLPGESVPLGVEGQVDELIKQATSQHNLAAMYIGWCPFL